MRIETKFNDGDIIHFISVMKRAASSTVRGFKIERLKGKTEVTYLCGDNEESLAHIKVPESEAFATKEELLKSL